MAWPFQDAKNRLSQVMKDACSKGPQVITLRGQPAVVVLSIAEYEKLQPKTMSFKEYLLSGPEWDEEFIEMVNDREKSVDRGIGF